MSREAIDAVRAGPIRAEWLACGSRRDDRSGRGPRPAFGGVGIHEPAGGSGHVRVPGQLLPVVEGHGARSRPAHVPVARVVVARAHFVGAAAGRFHDPTSPRKVQCAGRGNSNPAARHLQWVGRWPDGDDPAVYQGDPAQRFGDQPVVRLGGDRPRLARVIRLVGRDEGGRRRRWRVGPRSGRRRRRLNRRGEHVDRNEARSRRRRRGVDRGVRDLAWSAGGSEPERGDGRGRARRAGRSAAANEQHDAIDREQERDGSGCGRTAARHQWRLH